jgi:hypothetical protein
MLAKGYVEGPLHYTPHIVQGLGGVWKPEKDKWRTIVNGTSSGVNPASVPLGADYDMLGDVLAPLRPNMYMSGFDVSDAFLNWPIQEDSDLWGYKVGGRYYRYCYMAFGGCQSPSVQQRWARILKGIINEHGLMFCKGRAADYSTFSCTGAYVDDFAMQHAAHLTLDEAREQFASVERLLAILGFENKKSKNVYPCTRAVYVGFEIDTVAQTVGITEERAQDLTSEIDAELATRRAGGTWGRRALSSLVGKLQFVAQILTHGQRLLTDLYDMREAFVDPNDKIRPSLKARWAESVLVTCSEAGLAALEDWKRRLEVLPSTPIYLGDLTLPSGFWKGAGVEADEILDGDGVGGRSAHDVAVLTGDASGRASGGWFEDERMVYLFEPDECAPIRSSNFRELKTVLLMLERWGDKCEGRRVLVRSDNSTTVAAVNRGCSQHEGLRELAEAIRLRCQTLNIKLAARHIPGLKNGLADALSRMSAPHLRPGASGWSLDEDQWLALERASGRAFDVDAFADAMGYNSHCPRFWSTADSAFCHGWAGLHCWAFPDFADIDTALRHFRAEQGMDAQRTSAVFLVPEWTRAPWWKFLKSGRILGRFAAETLVLRKPDSGANEPGTLARPATTPASSRWPLVAIALGRGDDGDEPGAGRTGRQRGDTGSLRCDRRTGRELGLRQCRLSGDGRQDAELLRDVQAPMVPRVWGADGGAAANPRLRVRSLHRRC